MKTLQASTIAPVDMAQASIGPGMAVFSRYSEVLEADDRPMSVRQALMLINQELDTFLAEQEGEFDSYSRFAVGWFEQFGFEVAKYGQAEVMAMGRGTAVQAIVAGRHPARQSRRGASAAAGRAGPPPGTSGPTRK